MVSIQLQTTLKTDEIGVSLEMISLTLSKPCLLSRSYVLLIVHCRHKIFDFSAIISVSSLKKQRFRLISFIIYQNVNGSSPIALTIASVFLSQRDMKNTDAFEQDVFTLERKLKLLII